MPPSLARVFTILRNPYDVAASAYLYWGFPFFDVLTKLDWMAEVICHPHSSIKFAVSYNRLVSAQQAEVECLCQNLNLAFSPAIMGAIEKQHVPGAKKLLERCGI
jgi:hypothetical protein